MARQRGKQVNSATDGVAGAFDTAGVVRAIGDRSLEQSEGEYWGLAPADATALVASVHRLRTVPVVDLSPDELRLLIGQQIGLDLLIPLALDVLRRGPLYEATFYPGDLLTSVLAAPATWFDDHSDVAAALDEIVAGIDLTSTDEYGLTLAGPHVVDTIADWQQARSIG